ncbi:MAG: transglutaminase-like domain-containing protein [Bacteroidia bacterium]
MENNVKHTIKDVRPYLHLIPAGNREDYIVKRVASLKDSINFILWAIRKTAYQTERLAKVLNGTNLYNTCRVIFDWVYDHVEYRKDMPKKEQVRSPQRTIWDQMGDCEDMQILICTLLYNKKIPFVVRTTVYNWDTGVQHIYPVVITPEGREIVVDCVTNRFDYEVPYLKKYDYELPPIQKTKTNMELQFLNGVPDTTTHSIDAEDLLNGSDDFGDLGRGKGRLKNFIHKVQNSKVGKTIRKGLHIANRLNPVAATLRAGILIALKTNLFKVAERLRYSYLTPEQAQAMQLDMNKYNRLAEIRNQLEIVFYRSGGKTENFKKAILTGRGNRDKSVPLSGFGAIDYNNYTPENSSTQILGVDTYHTEFEGVEGFGGLGIAPAVAVAAATSVMTAIAALLKSIGDLKKKKAEDSSDGGDAGGGGDPSTEDSSTPPPVTDTSTNTDTSTDNTVQQTPASGPNQPDSAGGENTDTPASTNQNDGGSQEAGNTTTNAQRDDADSTGDPATSQAPSVNDDNGADTTTSGLGSTTKTGFAKAIDWVKAHPLPVIGGVIVLAGIGWGLHYYFKKKKETKKEQTVQTVQASYAGLPKKNNKRKIKLHKLR